MKKRAGKICLYITLLMFLAGIRDASGQEVVVPLMVNPVMMKNKVHHATGQSKATLTLPFLEDFSDGRWYPNPTKWSDDNVFVNHDYPVGAPSIGVATFDALDRDGAIYDIATAFPFPADTLTSQDIDLSAMKQSDSVYMSFFYQPQGIGNAPERDDSLVLEFWSEGLQKWVNIWADRGRTLDQFIALKGKPFAMVLLPVDSNLFFSPEFRFRFRNYASITDVSLPDWGGNVDQWHIDYIYLNTGQSINDTMIRNDITFRDYPKSLLKRYRSMPWKQFLPNAANEMHHSVAIPFSAYYHNVTSPVNMRYSVVSLNGGASYTPPFFNYGNLPMPYDAVMSPNSGTGFEQYVFAAPSMPYADFELMAWLQPFSTIDEVIRTNDTVRFYQKFYNYYAYDDGSAEAGYGLSSSNPNAVMMAGVRFDLNIPDTLKSIQMFFNQTNDNSNDIEFVLTVWNAVIGSQGDTLPGDTLYTQEEVRPVFHEGLNQYHTYELERPVPVNGSFFIGWSQKSGTMLNVGYDRNYDSKYQLRFNVAGDWLMSQYTGTVMIRPVLGSTGDAYISVPGRNSIAGVKFFPNPAYNNLNILTEGKQEGSNSCRLEMFNTSGKRVYDRIVESSADITELPGGIYMARVYDRQSGEIIGQSKIIVRK